MTTLKPCPFCGEKDSVAITNDDDNCIFVKCGNCNAQSDWFYFGEEKRAVETWNKRANEDE